MPEFGGFDFLVRSEIPTGAGLSSSAALELASALSFEYLSGKNLDKIERVRACRRAENDFVGVPCGILDQGVSGFGEKDRLVHIDCADETFTTVPGLEGTVFWIFESGKKHSLVDCLYSQRHAECSEALAAIRQIRPELYWLAHASLADLDAARAGMKPAVFKRAEHVIRENGRVRDCKRLLEKKNLEEVGNLLLASHWSSSALFENSIPELDTLVELLLGKEAVLGARLTGGGFGGAVMALCRDGFGEEAVTEVADSFRARHGSIPVCRRLEVADGAFGREFA